jgi:sortase B
MKRATTTALILLFVTVFFYSAYQLFQIYSAHVAEAEIHNMLLEFRPPEQGSDVNQGEDIVNQTVIDLQALYPNVVGWLTIPGTQVDYPFVQYIDNDFYLHHDINHNYFNAGTIFMDFRNKNDFSSQNTMIYGHNMINGSMFATLELFDNQCFFDEHRYATIFLPNETLQLSIFACIIVNPRTESEIYNIVLSGAYFEHVEQNALHFRFIDVTSEDRIVTFSTCVNDANDSRRVIIAKIQ